MEQDRLLLGYVGDEGRVGETLSRPQGRAVARAGFPKVVVRSKMGRHKGVPYTRPDGRQPGPSALFPGRPRPSGLASDRPVKRHLDGIHDLAEVTTFSDVREG